MVEWSTNYKQSQSNVIYSINQMNDSINNNEFRLYIDSCFVLYFIKFQRELSKLCIKQIYILCIGEKIMKNNYYSVN